MKKGRYPIVCIARAYRMMMTCVMAVSLQTVVAQVTPDTLRESVVQEVVVKGKRVTSAVSRRDLGELQVSTSFFDDMPKILGNADPLHYAQLLPGVQTVSEYDAGLHIQGSDNQHNSVTWNGVPLYNVSHLLGFFSVFNASHFSQMRLRKSATTAENTNRIGGFLDMCSFDSIPPRLSGELTVGPMSSQGTLKTRLGKKSFLVVSGRQAYLNWLYGRWLQIDGTRIRYSFYDYNLTYSYSPDTRNRLWIDLYAGNDRVSYQDADYQSEARLRWGNVMGDLHWETKGTGWHLHQKIYTTSYRNKFSMTEEFRFRLPSSVTDWGYQGKLNVGAFTLGADMTAHRFSPQSPSMEGSFSVPHAAQPRQHAKELSLYGSWKCSPLRNMLFRMGVRANMYVIGDDRFYSADPHFAAEYNLRDDSEFHLTASVKHQYVFKTGFSDAGLPTEFWASCNADSPPQYAYSVALGHGHYLFGRSWHVSLDFYYKRLYHQVEYDGSVFDFFYETYQPEQHLLHGNGENFGLNLHVERRTGKLTGWVSYSVGRAFRRFPGTRLHGKFPASHERIHELNAVATYQLGHRWSLGTTFVYASGTPFTAPRAFYVVNENIVSDFAGHNANTLRPYMRLDLSVNYKLVCKGEREQGFNFSLYNATAKNNDIYYRLKLRNGKFGYKPLRFVLPLMPSVSYYCKF